MHLKLVKLSQPSVKVDDFDSQFAAAVRTGLDKVVGESGTQAVLFYTHMPSGRLDSAIVDRRLVALFGEQAAEWIEREIVLDLLDRLDLPLPTSTNAGALEFVEIVHAAEKATSGG